jgi:hypothetical protein
MGSGISGEQRWKGSALGLSAGVLGSGRGGVMKKGGAEARARLL